MMFSFDEFLSETISDLVGMESKGDTSSAVGCNVFFLTSSIRNVVSSKSVVSIGKIQPTYLLARVSFCSFFNCRLSIFLCYSDRCRSGFVCLFFENFLRRLKPVIQLAREPLLFQFFALLSSFIVIFL